MNVSQINGDPNMAYKNWWFFLSEEDLSDFHFASVISVNCTGCLDQWFTTHENIYQIILVHIGHFALDVFMYLESCMSQCYDFVDSLILQFFNFFPYRCHLVSKYQLT